MRSEVRRDLRAAGLVSAALFLLFWLGRARTFGPGDSPQHALCWLTWGIPHPPGYPLQGALGWLWTHLPWRRPAEAANGLSGLLAALAGGMFYLLARRQGCRPLAALTGTALMSLAPLFWYYSLVAEVRSLNTLLAVTAALSVVVFSQSGKKWFCWMSCFTVGLGLSHHPTFLFVVASLVMMFKARKPNKELFIQSAVCLGAGLALPYAVLGVRLMRSAPVYNPWHVNGWHDLLPLFLRTNFGGPLTMTGASGPSTASGVLRQSAWWLSSLAYHAGPALPLAALGAAALWREDRRSFAAWALWLALGSAAVVFLGAGQLSSADPDYARALVARQYMLPWVALFVFAARGAEALAARTRPFLAAALAAAVCVGPVVLRPVRPWESLHAYARGLVRDSKPGDLVVLASDDAVFAVWYLRLVERDGVDRIFLTPSMFAAPAYASELAARHPSLRLPVEAGALSTDWGAWMRLNPGRAVLVEPLLRDAVLERWPASTPEGASIRVRTKAVPTDPAADARAFLSLPEVAIDRLASRFAWTSDWTQELYVRRSRRAMAEWVGSRLDPRRDAELVARYRALIEEL